MSGGGLGVRKSEQLSEIARTLPEQMAGEVLNFVAFLQTKEKQAQEAYAAELDRWFESMPPDSLTSEEVARLDSALADPEPRVSGESLFKRLGLS